MEKMKMLTPLTEMFSTSDLGQAAFLMTLGFALLRVRQGNRGDRKEFCFEPEAAEKAAGYFGGASVPARAFNHALRDLKTQLYVTGR
jgi:hypothetical protein